MGLFFLLDFLSLLLKHVILNSYFLNALHLFFTGLLRNRYMFLLFVV